MVQPHLRAARIKQQNSPGYTHWVSPSGRCEKGIGSWITQGCATTGQKQNPTICLDSSMALVHPPPGRSAPGASGSLQHWTWLSFRAARGTVPFSSAEPSGQRITSVLLEASTRRGSSALVSGKYGGPQARPGGRAPRPGRAFGRPSPASHHGCS